MTDNLNPSIIHGNPSTGYTYYCDLSLTKNGEGTQNNPWQWSQAINTLNVSPGDTVNLKNTYFLNDGVATITATNALGTKAYRAVGTALNKNPYSFSDGGDVPCHRVIKSNNEVGGFFSGTKEKIKILQREGIPIKQEKVIDVEKYLYKF